MNKKPFEKSEKKVNKSISNGSIIDRFLKKPHKSNNTQKYNSNHHHNNNNNSNSTYNGYNNNKKPKLNNDNYNNNDINNNNDSNNDNNNNIHGFTNRKKRREIKKRELVALETLSKDDKDLYWRKQNLKVLEENEKLLTGKDSEFIRDQLKKANSKAKLNENVLSDLSQRIKKTVEQVKCYRDRSVILRRMNELKKDRQLVQYGEIEFKIFGSSSVDLALSNSDIDMVMSVEKPLTSNQMRQWVYRMSQVLRFYGFERVQPIPFAKVPIIKFYDPKTQFDCDITLTRDSGNTRVVKEFCSYSPSVLPTLILFIKHWASRHGINDASLGTLSSYSITNMIIHILQLKNYAIPYCQLKELDQQQLQHHQEKRRCKKNELADILIYFFQYFGFIFNYRYSMINIGQDSNDTLNTIKPLEKFNNKKDSISIGIDNNNNNNKNNNNNNNSSNSDNSSDSDMDSENDDKDDNSDDNDNSSISSGEESGKKKEESNASNGFKLSHNDTRDMFYIKDCVEGHNITRCIQRDKLLMLIKEFQKAYATLVSGKLPI